MRIQGAVFVWSVLALASACGGAEGASSETDALNEEEQPALYETDARGQHSTDGSGSALAGEPSESAEIEQEAEVREMLEAAFAGPAVTDPSQSAGENPATTAPGTNGGIPDKGTRTAASANGTEDPSTEGSGPTETPAASSDTGDAPTEETQEGVSAQRQGDGRTQQNAGPNPTGDTVEGPISAAADSPYECIWQETQDAVECGTSVVRDAATCGYEITRDAALCGTEIVVDAAQCGTQYVTDAGKCGVRTVTDAAQCGIEHVTSAAQCGTQTVTSAALCGTRTVTSAALCGTQTITDLVECGISILSGETSCERPRTCSVANSCSVPLSCDVPRSCDVANTCEIANSCEVAAQCQIAAECEIANTCDVSICKQTEPGGQCTPGLAECDATGFSCQISGDSQVFRCLPNYNHELDPTDEALCRSLYVPAFSALAQDAGDTLAFSAGASASVGAKTSAEFGTVYGENGEYGCFVSTCVGFESDVQISDFANLGAYINWESFAGEAKTFSFGASIPEIEIGVSTTSVLDASFNQYIGQVDSVSIGLGLAPAQVGHGTCNTAVYVVDMN